VNYYNELSGLMTDSAIVRFLIKENFKDTYNILEDTGAILYLNNTINKWLLSIFIQGISEMYSNFIWDLFLLEGNIIIFKAIYAMIIILEKHLKFHRTLDELNNVFNNMPLKLNNRAKLAYYLIGKQFNFNMDIIKKYRSILSTNVIKEISGLGAFKSSEDGDEDEDDEGNKITCDLDWPQCLKDKKDLEKEYDFIVLKQLEEPNVIDDFIDNYDEYKEGTKIFIKTNTNNFLNDDDIESQKIKYFKEERFKDLLIERRKHFCNSNLMSIRTNFNKNNEKDKRKDRINAAKTVHISKKQFGKDKEDNDNETNNRIERIVTQVSKGNKNKISFVKEKVEKNIIFEDEKINGK